MGHGGEDNPQHTVKLSGFWVYRTKVTNNMYAMCAAAGKCILPSSDPSFPNYLDPILKDHPIVGVTWDQADMYCKWLDGRLPTEAEWEKAARGTEGNLYPWGDAQPTCDRANHANCVGQLTNVLDYPAGASEYKAFDFAGNSFEWVSDWYKATYYSESPAEDPTGPDISDVRSVRGSSFSTPADQLLPSSRYFFEPAKFRPDLGFRCVVEHPENYAPPCTVNSFVGDPSTGPSGGGPGGSSGSQATCEPPKLDVEVTTFCQKKLPYANVNLNGAVNLDMGGGDCTPSGDLYTCTGSDLQTYSMNACTICTPPTPEPSTADPSCPSGYNYNSANCTCEFTSADTTMGINCPSLLTTVFNAAQQCCQVPLQVAGSSTEEKPSCDPGYIPDGCTCVSGVPQSAEPITSCQEFKVSLPQCGEGDPFCNGCSCYTGARRCAAAGCFWDKAKGVCR